MVGNSPKAVGAARGNSDDQSLEETSNHTMGFLSRSISGVGSRNVITALGGLYIVVAIGRALLVVAMGRPISVEVADLILVGGPGSLILYAGYRLPKTDLHSDVYPRIVLWFFGGVGLLLGVVAMRILDPNVTIENPFWVGVLATALGSLAGLAIGMYEARALSRARDAEAHVQELQRERNLREQIAETSPVGIIVIDADGTLSFTNAHTAEILGYPTEELIGREYDTSIFEATDSDGEPIENTVFEQVLSTGEPVFDAIRQVTRPDGQRIWLSVNGAPLQNQSGEVTGVVFTAEDITEQKEQQQRLEQQNKRLESFAGMLAHELRNPLQIAQIHLQQAQPHNEDAAAEIETAHERMKEMIDVLLVTVRGSDANLDSQPVAITDVAMDGWADAAEAAQTETADLDVETSQTIQADPVHVGHLLRNLFRNSLEHGDENVTVCVGDLNTGFYIEDDGPGIPEDARDDVVKAGFTTRADGIGLGLTYVVHLAETYGWQYTITDSAAGGARFEFRDVALVSAEEELHQR